MLTPRDVRVLRSVRARLAQPRAWIKGTMAQREYGRRYTATDPRNADATCWCLAGGVFAEVKAPEARKRIIAALAQVIAPSKPAANGPAALLIVTAWNDAKGRRKAEVFEVLDRVIGAA